MKVACIGEAMVELSLSDDTAALGFAGDTLNTAIYMARLSDLEVAYVTRLGLDTFSDRMQAFIAGEGVSTDMIERDETRTVGLYAISVDAQGERSFTYWRGQSAARAMFGRGADLEPLRAFDLLYLSGITLAILPEDARRRLMAFMTTYRAGGGRFAFDGNYRPKLWTRPDAARQWITRAWESCDIALPSVDDEMALFGDATQDAVVKRLKSYGIADGALKCGEDGPISLGEPCAQSYSPATQIVDTTAAGDSFNAGYLAAKLTGASQADALLAGHNCACQVIGKKGAIIPIADWAS